MTVPDFRDIIVRDPVFAERIFRDAMKHSGLPEDPTLITKERLEAVDKYLQEAIIPTIRSETNGQ